MNYLSFIDELEKLCMEKSAATMKALREAASRIKNIKRPPRELAEMGPVLMPTTRQGRSAGAKALQQFQAEAFPEEAIKPMLEAIEPYAKKFPGRIYAGSRAGKMLDPAAGVRRARDINTYAKLHEALERGTKFAPGSLHGSPRVMVQDFNLRSRLTGKGATGLKESTRGLREGEEEVLRRQFQDAFKDPRALQFLQEGQRVPKAMQKAFMRANPTMSADEALDAAVKQYFAKTDREAIAMGLL